MPALQRLSHTGSRAQQNHPRLLLYPRLGHGEDMARDMPLCCARGRRTPIWISWDGRHQITGDTMGTHGRSGPGNWDESVGQGGWFLLWPLSLACTWPHSVFVFVFVSPSFHFVWDWVPISSSCKDIAPVALGPALMVECSLICLIENSTSKCCITDLNTCIMKET